MAIAISLLRAILPPACVYANPRSGLAGHQTTTGALTLTGHLLFSSGRSIAF